MGSYTEFPISNAILPFTPASAAGPASFDFAEDTDNGTDAATLAAPASIAASYTITLPPGAGTLARLSDVTYEQLDTNGDVGTGAGQLAIGNHDHSGVYQPADSDLTTLATAFITASAAGPASLDLAEDTDNGSNRIRLSAPAAVTSDVTITLPDAAGTLRLDAPIIKNVTASSSPTAIDFSGCEVVYVALSLSTVQLTANSAVEGKGYRVRLKQDATGGRAITLGTGFNIGDDVPSPDITSNTANEYAWIGVIGRSDGGVDLVTEKASGFS